MIYFQAYLDSSQLTNIGKKRSGVTKVTTPDPSTISQSMTSDSVKGEVGVTTTPGTLDSTLTTLTRGESEKSTRYKTSTVESETQKIAGYNTQHSRQRTLREYCKNSKDVQWTSHQNSLNMLYSDKVGLIYCYVPKVACTNWKRILRVFNGKSKDPLTIGEKQKVHKLKYPSFYSLNISSEIEWRKNVYYSFLFVRHPFERILSAYRNKLYDPYNSKYRLKYGSQILRLFRKGLSEPEYKSGSNVTFEEFVDYIILTYDTLGSKALNEHWQVMHNLCNPCSMKYNFIGKMDSLLQDAQSVLTQIGWDRKVKFPANATDKYQTKTTTLMKEFYGQLTRDSIDRLYEIYKPDFLAFDYPIDEY